VRPVRLNASPINSTPAKTKREANRDAQISAVVLRLHGGKLRRAALSSKVSGKSSGSTTLLKRHFNATEITPFLRHQVPQ